jgi:hypothetical protein
VVVVVVVVVGSRRERRPLPILGVRDGRVLRVGGEPAVDDRLDDSRSTL